MKIGVGKDRLGFEQFNHWGKKQTIFVVLQDFATSDGVGPGPDRERKSLFCCCGENDVIVYLTLFCIVVGEKHCDVVS